MTAIAPEVHRRRWWILAVLCLSLLIVFVGNSSLNVAIPTLSRELHATQSQLQWVIATYSLVFAGLLLTTGAFGDRYGRKGMLQVGLAVFLVACVVATVATSMWQLILCRGAMGLGAALIMPSTLSILVNVFPPEERTKAIAVWATVTGVAGGLGPVASGFLLTHFWFGSVFLINVPIVSLALIAGAVLLPRSRDPEEGKLDPVAALLSTVGVVAIVYGLIEAPDNGWGATTTLTAFVVGAVVLALFVLWELRRDEPMLDVRLFRDRAFGTGTAGMVLIFLSMYGVMFLLSQYLQLVSGYSPFGAAVRLLPTSPVMIMVAPLTPRLSARFGANRIVALGLALDALGLYLLRTIHPSTPYFLFLAPMMIATAGFGLTMSPLTAAIMSSVPTRRAGSGSAMNDASRELGAALGVAVMGSIAASRYRGSVDALTRTLPATVENVARSSLAGALRVADAVGGSVGAALRQGATSAFIDGLHLAVTAGGTFALLASIFVWRRLPSTFQHESALHDAVTAVEDVAELGLGGAMPVFPTDD